MEFKGSRIKIDLQDKGTPAPKVMMNPYQEVLQYLQ